MSLFKQKTNIELKKGFSLVETVIYIGMMTVLLFSLITLISSATSTYVVLKSSRNIERSAINIMNSINMYADEASVIDITNTKFDNASGSISLMVTDNLGHSTSTKIYLSNNQVVLSINNVVVGPLNLSDVRVTNLTFRNMSTSTFNGFKVEMTIDNGTSSRYFSENFYNSYILR
jgi:type II secretory pathway pseudopilin PulG